MSLSYYFEDLVKAYKAELEDLLSDSEGNDVLAKRLKEKRSQFAALLPMIELAPEMVAVVFHGEISILDPQMLYKLSLIEPDEFPSWDEVSPAVQFSTRAQLLVEQVLTEASGEHFLITAICLEYLNGKSSVVQKVAADDEEHDEGENGRDDDDEEGDLDEAGADWMSEQGFDRRE